MSKTIIVHDYVSLEVPKTATVMTEQSSKSNKKSQGKQVTPQLISFPLMKKKTIPTSSAGTTDDTAY